MEDGEQAFFFAAQETDSRFDRPSRASLNEQASPNDHYIVIKKRSLYWTLPCQTWRQPMPYFSCNFVPKATPASIYTG